MANINEVFKPYDPEKPNVSFNLPSKEEVLAAILGLIPGGRAMYSEYKNPDISWKERPDVKNDPELQMLKRLYDLHKKNSNLIAKPKVPKKWEQDYTIEEIFGY